MTDFGSTILNLGVSVLTGIVTAAVSVQFALRRFRAERTWERKVAAYTEIFDALYDIQRYASMRIRELEEGTRFDEEYEGEASRRSTKGHDAVRRAAIRGTFVVGSAAAAQLEQLVTSFDDPRHNDDPHDEITAILDATTKALVDLRAIAKADVFDRDTVERSGILRRAFGAWRSRSALRNDR